MSKPTYSKFKTRFAQHSDVVALENLVHEAYRGGKASVGWKNEHNLVRIPRADAGQIREMLEDENSAIIVALSDDKEERVVGSVLIERESQERALIGMLSVDPEFQNFGLGRTMVRAGEEVAANKFGSKVAMMTVYNKRPALLDWYKRLGYKETGETIKLPENFGPLMDDLHFVKIERTLN